MFLVLVVMSSAVWPQGVEAPTRTQCKQWDDAYLGVFEVGLVFSVVGTFLLALGVGLLGRLSWLAAAPRLRILFAAVFTLSLVELGVIGLPQSLGFGLLWLSQIDLAYFDCIPLGFGAAGLLQGLIGEGVAAVALWLEMTLLFAGGAASGGLLAFLVSEIVSRLFGLRQLARRESA